MKKIESVVLIDDSSIDNFIGKRLLESFAVTDIMIFENAILALDHLKKRDNPPDLLLVDIYMPLLNGFELIKIYKENKTSANFPTICLLSVSLYPDDWKLANEMDLMIIEKPLTKAKLIEIL